MNIDAIISILQKEVPAFKEPIVTAVSREKNPFTVLISCILSLRTKDAVTAAASKRLFKKAITPEQMIKIPEPEIQCAIYPSAFYKTKAKNIKKICRILLEKYRGKVPDTIEELLTLPNVGRKTANIVVTLAYNKPGIAVDTHVHRISNRIGIVKTKTPEETEFALRKILPQKYWLQYNDLLVTWGQNICSPISPWCSKCPIARYCRQEGVITKR